MFRRRKAQEKEPTMSEYHLWELVNDRKDLYELATQAVEEMVKEGRYFRKDEWDETDQTVVYAIHNYFWQRAVADPSHPPYTHRVNGVTMKKAVDAVIPNSYQWGDESQTRRKIYSLLVANDLLVRVGKTGTANTFYIREWPSGFTPGWGSVTDTKWISVRDKQDIQRQQLKAKKLAGPVTTTTDPFAIPLPNASAESVMEYLKKLLPAMARLKTENTRLKAEKSNLEEQLQAIQSQGKWEEVVEMLKKAQQDA